MLPLESDGNLITLGRDEKAGFIAKFIGEL